MSALESVHPLHNETLPKPVLKTGLGSSAALTTSLVAAVLKCVVGGGNNNPSGDDVHTTAQIAHCLAQGKVGSGFDVCSAVFGSGLYKRFDAAVLQGNVSEDHDKLRHILSTVGALDHTFVSLGSTTLPHGMHLVLGDVQGGSSTPGMASAVLEW
eukprot:PhF_6_TR6060/c0_g1_i1/m.8779/K00938/E2.7.4.2, mvaK2; phosphomevalonate kinase